MKTVAETEHKMTYAEYLKYLRRCRGYTLRELSKLTGISNPYLSQIERGKRSPSVSIEKKIAEIYGINFSQLVDFKFFGRESRTRAGTVCNYCIVCDTTLGEFELKIMNKMRDGWECLGSVVVQRIVYNSLERTEIVNEYYQAMVR